jgi:hypothetical protein
VDEGKVDYIAALRDGYMESSMELDRTVLNLSAGGIALLVTLLTAVGVPAWWVALVYLVPLAAFLSVIWTALAILDRNKLHTRMAVAAARSGQPAPRPDSETDRLDAWLRTAFWIGVFTTLLVGGVTMWQKGLTGPQGNLTQEMEDGRQAAPGGAGNEAGARQDQPE